MIAFPSRLLSLTLALGALASVYTAGAAQERSREEAIREAGRLVTEAQRREGEAHKKVQAGGDHRLVTEAERVTAERFRQALELWRSAGHDKRLLAGAEELSRLYAVRGDYEAMVGCLRREIEYWGGRGDLHRQSHLVWLMGLRQMQMRRDAAAVATFERAVEMSRAAGLPVAERDAVGQLARLYEQAGRGAEAARLRAREKELWSQIQALPAEVIRASPPPVIPAGWVDLPSAPLAAEHREIEGVRTAVLVNRSELEVSEFLVGCVAKEGGKARVLYGLVGQGFSHGGIGPGLYFTPFATLNGPLSQWTDEPMGCEGSARLAVTEAGFTNGTKWKAEGAPWAER